MPERTYFSVLPQPVLSTIGSSASTPTDTRLATVETNLSALTARLDSSETTITGVSSDLDALRTESETSTTRLSLLETTLDELRADTQGTSGDSAARLAALETTMDQLRSDHQTSDSDHDARLSSLETTLNNIQSQLDALVATVNTTHAAQLGELDTKLTSTQSTLGQVGARQPTLRKTSVPAPALAPNQTKEVAVTWPTPMPDSNYSVWASREGASGLLGKFDMIIKPGTRTTHGVTLIVWAGLTLSSGGTTINVMATTTP